jgi:hypothetical protein
MINCPAVLTWTDMNLPWAWPMGRLLGCLLMQGGTRCHVLFYHFLSSSVQFDRLGLENEADAGNFWYFLLILIPLTLYAPRDKRGVDLDLVLG